PESSKGVIRGVICCPHALRRLRACHPTATHPTVLRHFPQLAEGDIIAQSSSSSYRPAYASNCRKAIGNCFWAGWPKPFRCLVFLGSLVNGRRRLSLLVYGCDLAGARAWAGPGR